MRDRNSTLKLSRRQLLQAGLAAGATLSSWPLYRPAALWGQEAGPPSVEGYCTRVGGIPCTSIRISHAPS